MLNKEELIDLDMILEKIENGEEFYDHDRVKVKSLLSRIKEIKRKIQ